MKLSTDGILTTHTGSLPRPEELVKLTYAQEEGKPVDHDVMAAAQARAVEQVVRHQAEAGIDVVSDGEMSKPGFTNYLTSRVTGYEGRAAPWVLDDLVEFPDLVMEQYGGEAGAHIVMRNCTGDIRYVGQDAVATDVAALSKAMSGIDVAEGVPARDVPRLLRADGPQPAIRQLRELPLRPRPCAAGGVPRDRPVRAAPPDRLPRPADGRAH